MDGRVVPPPANEPQLANSIAPTTEARDTLPSPPPSTGSFHTSVFRLNPSPPPIRSPEPSSINDIIRRNNRTRLYILPIYWTRRHLQLLDCQFVLEEDGQQPKRQRLSAGADYDGVGYLPPDWVIGMLADRLLCPSRIPFRSAAVREFLGCCHVYPAYRPCLFFHFNRRMVAILEVDGLFSCSLSALATPTLAYLDLQITETRRNMSAAFYRSMASPPVAQIKNKKRRSIQPDNELEDPYITAVLICLAQVQQQDRWDVHINTPKQIAANMSTAISRLKPFAPQASHYIRVHLLARAKDNEHLYFYTADVPSAFLNKFDEPSRYITSEPLVISYYPIPLRDWRELKLAMGHTIRTLHDKKL